MTVIIMTMGAMIRGITTLVPIMTMAIMAPGLKTTGIPAHRAGTAEPGVASR